MFPLFLLIDLDFSVAFPYPNTVPELSIHEHQRITLAECLTACFSCLHLFKFINEQ